LIGELEGEVQTVEKEVNMLEEGRVIPGAMV
jgi:hypothetical protein